LKIARKNTIAWGSLVLAEPVSDLRAKPCVINTAVLLRNR
jgi:hypothetical protein